MQNKLKICMGVMVYVFCLSYYETSPKLKLAHKQGFSPFIGILNLLRVVWCLPTP